MDIVQKRWKALHEKYTKEHKKGKTGDSAEDVVVNEWEHYQLMEFQHEFIKHRK